MAKKIIFIILIQIVLLRINFIEAQTTTGFCAGINFSQLTGSHTFDEKIPRKGLYGGIFLDITVAFESSIEIGAFYSQQGVIYRNVDNLYSIKKTYTVYRNLDYVMVPINWKQMWGDVYTKIGMYGEFDINPTSTWKESIETQTNRVDSTGEYFGFVNNLKLYDIGVNFGIGLMTPISDQFDLFLDVTYRMGFFPIENTYIPEQIKKNRIFCISTGIILRGKENRYAPNKRK